MKNMTIYIIIFIVILILIGGYFWYNRYMLPSEKVIKYRVFSCLGMTGFTFKYPVFEGWELNGWAYNNYLKYERCITNLVEPNKIDPRLTPSIEVKKMSMPDLVRNGVINLPDKVDTAKLKVNKNPSDVLYSVSNNILSFYIDNSFISIELMNSDSFFKDQFFKTVIESFKLTD